MAFSILLGISASLLLLFDYYWFWTAYPLKEFYLLEGDTLYRILSPLTMGVLYFLFFRGTMEGYKAWRLLRHSETDDEALLEGSQRLGKMFRWLVIWGGVFVARILLVWLSQNWMSGGL